MERQMLPQRKIEKHCSHDRTNQEVRQQAEDHDLAHDILKPGTGEVANGRWQGYAKRERDADCNPVLQPERLEYRRGTDGVTLDVYFQTTATGNTLSAWAAKFSVIASLLRSEN